MRQFLIISCSFLLLISCKTYEIPNINKKESTQNSYTNFYFSDPEKDYIYKAGIEIYGKQLGGIFVAKKINDTLHRVVLTTDFGNTLLDFELSENSFKVNYCVDELNRKIIHNTLKNDFRLLFKEKYIVNQVFENELNTIFKSKDGNRFNFLIENKTEQKLIQLIHASKTKEKVIISFESKSSNFAENIIIEHHNINLKITLNQINN